MTKTGWTEEKEQHAIDLYRTTAMNAGQIAQALGGVSPWMVRQALRRHGIRLKRGRREGSHPLFSPSDAQRDHIIHRYLKGTATEPLAAEFGVSSSTIQRWLRTWGVPLRSAGFQQGEEHYAWKGGRIVTDSGYVLVLVRPDDPFYPMAQIKTTDAHYCLEHRLVMAKHLGRLLTEDETVHHVNDKERQNNDIANLQLRRGNHGKGAALQCADCGSHNIIPVPLASAR